MPETLLFRHEAMLYDGPETFVAGAAPFIRAAVAAHEPIMVAVGAEKIDLLRSHLGEDAEGVVFADMAEVGANPARIIPAWRDFVDANSGSGRPMRGIGEPIWADRSADELVECQCHEALLNMAFADAPAFHLLCPYDTAQLDAEVIAEAERSHPYVGGAPSGAYRGHEAVPHFAQPLAQPPAGTPDAAEAAGLSGQPVHDLVLAVHEIATNSVRHGGGTGTLRMWQDHGTVICEIRD